MNTRAIFALISLAAIVCAAWAADQTNDITDYSYDQSVNQNQNQVDPNNCPVRNTVNLLRNSVNRMVNQVRQGLSNLHQQPSLSGQTPISRRKRQIDRYDEDLQQQPTQPTLNDQYPLPSPSPLPSQPLPQPKQASARDMAIYNQSIREHESRMQSLMRQIMNSPYMPSREQTIQLATTVLTLLLMMLLGPAIGSQAGMIQAAVKQVVPLLVAATVHYAANQASPMKPMSAQIPQAHIEPVQVQPSMTSQAI